ncbi:MAG: amino acid permease [bacterium]
MPPAAPTTTAEEPPAEGGLRRDLNLFGAVSMIVGIVIGSGIFIGVNRVAAGAGSPWLIILVWVIGGLLTLMGALTYAELGVMFPRAGGPYVFLREGLGPLPAFLAGWTTFTVNLAGSAAALALAFATQFNQLRPGGWMPLFPDHPEWSAKIIAACVILLIAILNYFGLRLGGNVQKSLTVLKGTLMVFLAAAALFWLGNSASPVPGLFDAPAYQTQAAAAAPVIHEGFDLAGFFGLALVAALFAYDGWTNVTTVGSEIKNPSRNLPRAMLLGIGAVIVLYILLSFGYMHVLGLQGFADGKFAGFGDASKVAGNTASVLFGDAGLRIVAATILVSVLGSLNGITISGPRYYYAMARDGLFPRFFGGVNRHHVPGHSIWGQAILSVLFLLFLDFDQLTNNVVFVSLFFYSLCAVALLVLRRRRPDLPRPYKVPLYPWIPLTYIAASMLFAGYLTYQAVLDASGMAYRFLGLAIIAAGVPMYYAFRWYYRRGTPQPN